MSISGWGGGGGGGGVDGLGLHRASGGLQNDIIWGLGLRSFHPPDQLL